MLLQAFDPMVDVFRNSASCDNLPYTLLLLVDCFDFFLDPLTLGVLSRFFARFLEYLLGLVGILNCRRLLVEGVRCLAGILEILSLSQMVVRAGGSLGINGEVLQDFFDLMIGFILFFLRARLLLGIFSLLGDFRVVLSDLFILLRLLFANLRVSLILTRLVQKDDVLPSNACSNRCLDNPCCLWRCRPQRSMVGGTR